MNKTALDRSGKAILIGYTTGCGEPMACLFHSILWRETQTSEQNETEVLHNLALLQNQPQDMTFWCPDKALPPPLLSRPQTDAQREGQTMKPPKAALASFRRIIGPFSIRRSTFGVVMPFLPGKGTRHPGLSCYLPTP